MKVNNPTHSMLSLKGQVKPLKNTPNGVQPSGLAYFQENTPIEKRKDPITGRPVKGKDGCLPFNRKVLDWEEMDVFFSEV